MRVAENSKLTEATCGGKALGINVLAMPATDSNYNDGAKPLAGEEFQVAKFFNNPPPFSISPLGKFISSSDNFNEDMTPKDGTFNDKWLLNLSNTEVPSAVIELFHLGNKLSLPTWANSKRPFSRIHQAPRRANIYKILIGFRYSSACRSC